MSYEASASPSVQPMHLQFDDNRLLPLLFGEHDQNLARIEKELGVTLVSRGNQLAISGPATAVSTARTVLTGLYQRLKRGLEVDRGEVEAAMRLARQDDGLEPNLFGADAKDGTAIRTQRRHITPRSAVSLRSGKLWGGGPSSISWGRLRIPHVLRAS